MTQEIVYNARFSKYCLSHDFIEWMKEQGDEQAQKEELVDKRVAHVPDHIERTNELLVETVKGNTDYDDRPCGRRGNDLRVTEVPEDIEWEIEVYDGLEAVQVKKESVTI